MSNRVCHFKLVLLGDTAVGKSCLVVRFVRDEFFEFQEPTIGGERKKGGSMSGFVCTLELVVVTRYMEGWVLQAQCYVGVLIFVNSNNSLTQMSIPFLPQF